MSENHKSLPLVIKTIFKLQFLSEHRRGNFCPARCLFRLCYCETPIYPKFFLRFSQDIRHHRWPTWSVFFMNICPMSRESTIPFETFCLFLNFSSRKKNEGEYSLDSHLFHEWKRILQILRNFELMQPLSPFYFSQTQYRNNKWPWGINVMFKVTICVANVLKIIFVISSACWIFTFQTSLVLLKIGIALTLKYRRYWNRIYLVSWKKDLTSRWFQSLKIQQLMSYDERKLPHKTKLWRKSRRGMQNQQKKLIF